jgi:integrase
MKNTPKLTAKMIAEHPLPPAGKVAKLYDANGLLLVITGSGQRGWRFKFRLAGIEKQVSLGVYPDVPIEAARTAALAAKKLVAKGLNPADLRREKRAAEYIESINTFAKVGREFLALDDTRAKRTSDKHQWQFEQLAPLHKKLVTDITAPDVLKVLRGLEAQGKREAAHRCAQFAGRVFRYAIQCGHCTVNPACDLRGALKPVKTVSHAGITDPLRFGELMVWLDANRTDLGFINVRNGLRLLARTFVRPGELRAAEWSEINLDTAEWKIPAERMKMKRPHLVPLSTQAVAILRNQYEVTGHGALVFPGVRSGRPMSDATMGIALKVMLIESDRHVPHGFRVSASTLLNEKGFDPALVDMQLSHAKRDKVASVYDRSQRVPERKAMMQAWSDYIEELKLRWVEYRPSDKLYLNPNYHLVA